MSDSTQGSRVGGQFGPYHLKRLLGRGGMGEVYEAHDTVKDRVVAVKLMSETLSQDPVFRKRMLREAHTAGRLQEPHVVPIHDYGEIDGQLYIDMRLIDGTDLSALLKRLGPLAAPRAVAIVRQVAAALDAAHATGVTHRDVKPENVLITGDDFAYLADFGLASATTDERLTQLGSAVGTWKYMAPERFSSEEVTYRADIYALACVLYECLTGSPPYRAGSASVLVTAHLMEDIPRPSRTGPGILTAFDEVIACGMAKKPEDRYPSAGDLALAAERALSTPDQDEAGTLLGHSLEATLPGAGSPKLLPTGTVTLLLADAENSTGLWESQPEEMTSAFARLDRTLADAVRTYHGARPVEQGEGDSFVLAFTRATDAVSCALAVQRAQLAPIRLRIGVHTGEIQLRDEANYIGPTINRTARIRNLAHGGQTVLSGVTEELVADRLPPDLWLTDLGSYPLRGVPHPERVFQLCHPDLENEFPPLRVSEPVAGSRLPAQLTSFVGREAELTDVRQLVSDHRLVTLTGAGGVGKTRLAVELAGQLADRFRNGVWWVDLAPITDPDLVAVAVARALDQPDQPGRSAVDTLIRFIADRDLLVVLDNCEHLLDACAALTGALLGGCARLRILATSREPIGVSGEATWRTPSLSLGDEAIELFTQRARLARPDFGISGDNAAVVVKICSRLDGVPLAIELAAARVRALSLTEIADGLRDRFRLLTGGARTALPRQQTLLASVDWSHALLAEPERVLFRRLAVFMGGFDLDAVHAVAGGADVPRYQILDQLTSLVDKSLVVAEDSGHSTRYRLLETVRQYALDKLGESGETEAVRTGHRDHYTALAAPLDTPSSGGHEQRVELADSEIDNLRAAFAWSQEHADIELALRLASSLQPLWLSYSRSLEGLAWFNAVLTGDSAAAGTAARARALADKVQLDAFTGAYFCMDQAGEALAIARELDDPALLARVLNANGATCSFSPPIAMPYFQEAIELARALGDNWRLSEFLGAKAWSAFIAGDPTAVRAAAEEGRDLAEANGYLFMSRMCRWCIGCAQLLTADLAAGAAQSSEVAADAQAAHDSMWQAYSLVSLGTMLSYQGDTSGARAAAEAAIECATDVTGLGQGASFGTLVYACLAGGDVAAALAAGERAGKACDPALLVALTVINVYPLPQLALAKGDVSAARRSADDALAVAMGAHRMVLLGVRVRVAIAQGEFEQAHRDAHDALAIAAETKAYVWIPDIIECLAGLASDSGSHREAARLFGSAQAIRGRTSQVRFTIYDADYTAAVGTLREAMDTEDFEVAWAEGGALSTDEAIASALPRVGDGHAQPAAEAG